MIVKTKIECSRICKYFEGELIGSILLASQIDDNLINDIDVAIDEKKYFQVQAYLKDLGFKETKGGYKQSGYADTIGSCIFQKNNYLPIHICLQKNGWVVLSNKEIWAEKIKRYSESDIKQIKSLFNNNIKCPW